MGGRIEERVWDGKEAGREGLRKGYMLLGKEEGENGRKDRRREERQGGRKGGRKTGWKDVGRERG